MSKKYKGILLDLDNTLYAYDDIHGKSLMHLYRLIHTLGIASTVEQFLEDLSRAKKIVKKNNLNLAASHNRLLYFQGYLEMKNKFTTKLALRMYETYWGFFLSNLELYSDALEFLKSLKDIPVVIVTDLTAHIQFKKVEQLGIMQFIEAIVTSEEAGCEKPSERIFKIAIDKINLKPSEICFIGDNFKKDIIGANKVGVDAFYLDRDNKGVALDSKSFVKFQKYGELNEYF